MRTSVFLFTISAAIKRYVFLLTPLIKGMSGFTRLAGFTLCFFIINILSCTKEYSCENCINQPPVADAGPDQHINIPGDSLSLDGSASSDPDGSIEHYLWRQIDGPSTLFITEPTSPLTVINNLREGIYLFELKIADNGGLSAKDTTEIIIKLDLTPRHPPVARIREGDFHIVAYDSLPRDYTVILEGDLSSDPDNDIVEYSWRRISGPEFFMANPSAVNLKVSRLYNGTTEYELKVTDSKGLYSKDTAQVKIEIL